MRSKKENYNHNIYWGNHVASRLSQCRNRSRAKKIIKKTDSETVKIEDIDWNVGEGIIDGDRHIVMNYVNNSKLDIVYFGLDYTEKEEITEEEKQKFYSDIEKKFNLSDDDMIKIKRRNNWNEYKCRKIGERRR